MQCVETKCYFTPVVGRENEHYHLKVDKIHINYASSYQLSP